MAFSAHRSICCLTALALAAQPAIANESDRENARSEEAAIDVADAALQASAAAAPGQYSALSLPLDEMLSALARTFDVSFVFDSRIIRNKRIAPISFRPPPNRQFEDELRKADLTLHQINARTFAITAAPPVSSAASAPIGTAPAATSTLVDTIIVTASASTALASSGSNRLFEFDENALELLNKTTPAQTVYDLPQSVATISPSNTALQGPTAGISLADLRALGPERTLILVNGRRRGIISGGNGTVAGVDLNSFSQPFLERIEVSNRSSGARLGPEAVSGTINFVTRKNIDGAEIGGRFGVSEQRDNEQISLYALGGSDRLLPGVDISFGVSFFSEGGLIGADRPATAVPFGFSDGVRRNGGHDARFLAGFGGSSYSGQTSIAGALDARGERLPFRNDDFFRYNIDENNDVQPFDSRLSQLYNWSAVQSTVLGNSRGLAYFDLSSDLTNRLQLFAEGHFGVTDTEFQLAPIPAVAFRGSDPVLGDGFTADLSGSNVPQNIRDFALAQFGPDVENLVLERRFVEVGPREQDVERLYTDFIIGLNADLDSRLDLSAHYRFGRNVARTSDANRINRDRLDIALDENACAAVADCAFIDLFDPAGVSRAAAAYIAADNVKRRLRIAEHEVQANAGYDVAGGLFNEARIDAGISIRRTIFEDRSEIPDGLNLLGAFNYNDPQGSLTVYEAYANAASPLLSNHRFLGDVDINLAGRITGSSVFGAAGNFEAAADWRPAPFLTLYTHQHIGARPPNVVELFTVDASVESFFLDPCSDIDMTVNPTVASNCLSGGPLGVEPGFMQTRQLATQTFYGAADLDAERVRSAAYGVSFSPTSVLESLPGVLELSATWLDIEIKDLITAPVNPLGDCYRSENLSSRSCGLNPQTGELLIQRDPSNGQVASIGRVLQNDGSQNWSGLDLELRYSYEPENFGPIDKIWISGLHTYTDSVDVVGSGNPVESDLVGLVDYPRHRSLIASSVKMGRATFAAFVQRRGRVATNRSGRPETEIPAFTYVDLTARLELDRNAVLLIGVENLTDRNAPIVAGAEVGNTHLEYYDIVGRRYSLALKIPF